MTVLSHPTKSAVTPQPDVARPVDRAGERTIARFEIRYRQYLDAGGKPLGPLPPFARDPKMVVPLYEAMALTRAFDAKAVALQRTGQLGTFPSSLGQEAVSVGVASAMDAEDVFLPTYREHGALLWRGVKPEELLRLWGGDEAGADWSGPREDFPPCIPIATHAPHAVGVAAAFKLRGERRVAVCVLGDGATSKGDFYEAMNLAGVWQLPVVFVIANNGWAISVPRTAQTASETLAQKAIAAGLPGEQVDGNDVIAVREAAEYAIRRARQGGGATVIEALTYRLSDHTTADDASRYRAPEEVSAEWRKEPVARLRAYLSGEGWWTKADEERLMGACKATVEAAAEAYKAMPPPRPTDMFDHLYGELPADLAAQRAAVEEESDHG